MKYHHSCSDETYIQFSDMKTPSLLQSTKLFSIATFTSRIFGLIRDSVISAYLPVAWQDIFWAGVKIPSTFRQLFAEGSLSAAFIPMLSKVREEEGEEKAREVSFAIFSWLATTLTCLTALLILFGPWWIPVVLDFPADQQWKVGASVTTTQMMFPFLVFVGFSAWSMGILNTYRSFFMPALAPVFYNITVIVGAIVFTWYFQSLPMVYYLPKLDHGILNFILSGWAVCGTQYFGAMPLMICMCGVVIVGGIMQFAVQIPQLRKLNYFPPKWVSVTHPAVKSFLYKLAPAVFGLAVFQLNALITQTYFASRYGEGGISILTYAHRLIQFPLGVIGIALATASFPQISQHFARNEHSKAAKLFTTVSKYMMLIMLPSAAGLIVLDQDIVGLIYNWKNKYSPEWMSLLGMSLTGYSVGLLGYAFVKILAQSFQAQHDFRTPVITGAAGVAVNLTLCAFFSSQIERYPLWTMTFASSAATFVNVLLLIILLRMKLHELKITPLILYFFKVITASLLMYGSCWLVMSWMPESGDSFLFKVLRVGIGMTTGILSYGILGRFLFWTELKAILRIR